MQDIISGAAKKRSPAVVKFARRLPARLRRTVRDQVAHESRRAPAPVRFTRHSITVGTSAGKSTRQPRRKALSWVPPYSGRFMQAARVPVPQRLTRSLPTKAKNTAKAGAVPKSSRAFDTKLPDQHPAQADRLRRGLSSDVVSAARSQKMSAVAAATTNSFSHNLSVLDQGTAGIGSRRVQPALPLERDVPYVFSGRRSLSLPHSRFKPMARWRLALAEPRVLLNAALLFIGCLVLLGLMWQLRGIGRGVLALGSLREQTGVALESVITASTALAETDFATSEQQFADAGRLLAGAERELDRALASSRVVLRYLDVTGTVRSGEELLAAGQALSAAGESTSRGMALLLQPEDPSLAGGIAGAEREFTQAVDQLEQAEAALARVNGLFLPPEVRVHVGLLAAGVPRARAALASFVDQSNVLRSVLGIERERQYLLLFENNHELRPTGGFIGSLALINVDRGVISGVDVRSVYDPDGQLKEFIAPPDPLLSVTRRWYLRDANWFVDWPVSARKVANFFEKEGGPTVDGVIALTPEVIRSLLSVTGPINVPGYDVAVSAENFWEVTQDQVTYSYDKELNRPKQFLADLAPLLLQRLQQAPAESSLRVLDVVTGAVEEKHLLLYFSDNDLQELLLAHGWAGSIPRDQQGFLAINNANIGGHKSDQFVAQDVDVRYDVRADGDVDVNLTVRRTHRGPEEAGSYEFPADENPAQKNNVVYQRVLVPAGAQLIDAAGFAAEAEVPLYVVPEEDGQLKVDPDVAEWQRGQTRHSTGTIIGTEAGYTFFANWVVTRPGSTTMTSYHYRLPRHAAWPSIFDPAERFETYFFKQPGDTQTDVTITLRLPDQAHIVHAVPATGLAHSSAHEVVYRGQAQRDSLVGVVFEVE